MEPDLFSKYLYSEKVVSNLHGLCFKAKDDQLLCRV